VKRIAIDLQYLPGLEYFAAIRGVEEIFLLPKDRYQRQSFTNRTQVLLANKVQTLSIPIQGRRPRVALDEVRIDYTQNWVAVHLRGLQSAYGKAPFFEYFFPYIEAALLRQEPQLWTLNLNLLTICLKLLRWPVKLTVLNNDPLPADVVDLRGQIVPSSPFSERSFYTPMPYTQLFGADFVPNLSVMDLLFCTGTDADDLLQKSQKKHEQ
jgi:hypothetical protein